MDVMEVDFTEKIKGVFDVCDTEGTGFITVDHLKSLAKEHFGADNEEVLIFCLNQHFMSISCLFTFLH